ncbi:MAG: coproporphyrinogen dehydrogenase HemZ [Oscillospiraceae bacterium]|jgi:oxygen-independent coproporphyrinogen-3 oxidase|nr:coproporphyrinogen dehydrogenase HemZ [Oscillospiraceae bacterium]
MKLYLRGHNEKYAAEQIMLQMFPEEKPQFVDSPPAPEEKHVRVGLGAHRATAAVYENGVRHFGAAQIKLCGALSDTERLRARRRAIKNAVFRAAQKARPAEAPWGSAAGIRPASIVTKMLLAGMDRREAAREFRRSYFVSKDRTALALSCAGAELEARAGFSPRDVAVYLGVPFCPTRCAYCSFVSLGVEKSLKLLPSFADALLLEIAALGAALRGTGAVIFALYIGGGTPTTLSDSQLDIILTALREHLDLSSLREFTVEAGRPDTITESNAALLRAHGAGRVSVNPQTFSDAVLTDIGRRHTVADTYRAYETVRAAGFDAVNMDLIAGLPGDTPAGFARSLDLALELAPENITVHSLSRKRGSRVTTEETPVPDGGSVARMLDYSIARLSESSFSPYYLYRQKFTSGGFENTGWTKPGHVCLYNIAMMDEAATVLSLGGGGVTKLLRRDSGKITRIFNPKYPYEYIERLGEITARKADLRKFFSEELGV